jgi:hypothetical protein
LETMPSNVFSRAPLNITFRRQLANNNLVMWHNLVHSIIGVCLNNQNDVFQWDLHQNGKFSIHSMYPALISNNAIIRNTLIWKLKIPLKIKIFIWYLFKEVVLTKRNWNGGSNDVFAMRMRRISTNFPIANTQKICGVLSLWRLMLLLHGVYVTYLAHG